MTLRAQLLLGYGGFILALGVLGAWSVRSLSQMSAVSSVIISENYDSVVAAQDMKESLERQDSAAVFDLLGEHERARQQAADHRARFDAALAKAAGNITEPGERETVEAIRRGRDDYYLRFDEFLGATGNRTARYFEVLEPRFDAVRADCDRLLRVNQEAMRHKADRAAAIARRWYGITLGLVLALMLLGVAVAFSLSHTIVGPVRQLTEATTKVARGDLDATVPIRSTNELGTLAVGFNQMAQRIRELRRSDLGKLLIAQQTTEAAIDSLYDPVIVTDGGGLVTRINPAAERLFGVRAETIGRPIAAVARGEYVAVAVGDVLQSGRAVASEGATDVLPWAVDGSRRAFRVRSTPMRDAEDRLVGTVTLLEDVTHLSEISRLKSEFIAAASHELRTPLTSIQMGVNLMLEGIGGRLSDRQHEILESCRDETARLDRLMRQLLDLSKIESGAAAPSRSAVRPAVIVQEAVDSLRLQIERRGLKLDVRVPETLPEVFADRDQIERVLVNLLTNASRATPAGGAITVEAMVRGRDVVFSVTDTGVGIARESLTRIFDPFVQLGSGAGGGSGLGLTISRRIVEAHGGQLTAQSEVGRGSTFIFNIPAAGDHAIARPTAESGVTL
jgi:PAS domain S-box-containing protein